jgi:D-tyrosyl-tRNA(Tyr) deacylase
VVQRVREASVVVDGATISEIGAGLLVLVGVAREDAARDAEDLARKLVHLRIFEDDAGLMNRSLCDTGGALCVVSQFTLLGDTGKGRRPFFGEAAEPSVAEPLVEAVVAAARSHGVSVVTGRFGAHMEVSLTNDGPVTLWLDTRS